MEKNLNVATAPKTGTFQMRINPQIKEQVESIYARCGMTLTHPFGIFAVSPVPLLCLEKI